MNVAKLQSITVEGHKGQWYLTLGTHVRGLQYLVCVCVCLSVRHHESSHYAQLSVQLKVPMASAQAGKHFKYGVFSKMLHSKVMASFTYLAASDPFMVFHLDGDAYSCLKA